MDISTIWISQRNLRRAYQIPDMIKTLKEGEELPRITLIRCEDGEVQVHDGHHRLIAHWLAGHGQLQRHEYILLEQDRYHRARCGKIERLVTQWEDQERSQSTSALTVT